MNITNYLWAVECGKDTVVTSLLLKAFVVCLPYTQIGDILHKTSELNLTSLTTQI